MIIGSNGGSRGQSWSGGEKKRDSIPPPLLRLPRRDGEMPTRYQAFPGGSRLDIVPINPQLGELGSAHRT